MSRQTGRKLIVDLVRTSSLRSLVRPPSRLDPTTELADVQGNAGFVENPLGCIVERQAREISGAADFPNFVAPQPQDVLGPLGRPDVVRESFCSACCLVGILRTSNGPGEDGLQFLSQTCHVDLLSCKKYEHFAQVGQAGLGPGPPRHDTQRKLEEPAPVTDDARFVARLPQISLGGRVGKLDRLVDRRSRELEQRDVVGVAPTIAFAGGASTAIEPIVKATPMPCSRRRPSAPPGPASTEGS